MLLKPPLLPLGLKAKDEKGENSSQIHNEKWRGVRFKVGGANLNFEQRLRGKLLF
jgi:hypothetical protein